MRPLRAGVISEPDAAEAMLRWFTDRVGVSSVFRPRMVVCIPSDVTGVERRAVEEAALRVGARRVYLVEEPMVAAIGAGLPVTDTEASMVVDIGGGSTDVAVIALGGIVASRSTRVAGDALDDAIVDHVRRHLSLLLGERSAEHIKVEVGSAFPPRPRGEHPGAWSRPRDGSAQDRRRRLRGDPPGHRRTGRADRLPRA
ncbi:rod shape-determining protein MreB [Janibacter hoylei PVAS-1]|uniref:Rod shape-determining protein MreB n=1 Tax=Janibacter hoylei PVAS-1 TaxID=1210046 RepID=K1E3S0_9MICO|nr:rod shape-determining protein MreB [Janibacter hoylei PVAS-1]